MHEAATVLEDPLSTTFPDETHSREEARFLTLGVSSAGHVLVAAHTERGEAFEQAEGSDSKTCGNEVLILRRAERRRIEAVTNL